LFEYVGLIDRINQNRFAGSGNTQFFGQPYATNPARSFPDNGLGLMLHAEPTDWLFLHFTMSDSDAVSNHSPFTTLSGHWLYAGGRPVLHLSLASPAEGRTTAARTTFDHVAFDCRGRAGYEAVLAERDIAYEVARVPGTAQVQVFFSDPAGNGVELDFADDAA